jgi:hypothetical protein
MANFIVKLRDKYLEWSTIVDAPVSSAMTLDGLRSYIWEKYGTNHASELDERLERVERNGTSSLAGHTAEDLVRSNRAGKNETRLTVDEILEQYA